MIEIIPAINAADWETVRKQINLIAPYSDWVHLDVTDGKFTKNLTWNTPEDLKGGIPTHVRFEAHLMIAEPEKNLQPWIKAGMRRIILQWEALRPSGPFKFGTRKAIQRIASQFKENWVEFGLSCVFRTDIRELEPYLPFLDMVQVLAVEPGLAGQKFQNAALEHVSAARRMVNAVKPEIKIEVDGGVNTENIKDIYFAGANVAAAASAIFGAAEPNLALEALKRAVLG